MLHYWTFVCHLYIQQVRMEITYDLETLIRSYDEMYVVLDIGRNGNSGRTFMGCSHICQLFGLP